MIIIKLGGSVITDKTKYRAFKKGRVSRLCDEIKMSGKDVIIVHGAGSFGHIVAKKYSLQNGYASEGQIPALAMVSLDVRELNTMMMTEIINSGINAISIPPSAAFRMKDGEIVGDTTILKKYVELGIMPVMFGDVAIDDGKEFSICSGDKIMEMLADLFNPEMVVFVSDVDGLYDCDPKTNKNAELFETVDHSILNNVITEMDANDVTGGVHEKMEAMLRMSSAHRDCVLVNGTVEGRLLSVLKNEKTIYTRAKGGMQ